MILAKITAFIFCLLYTQSGSADNDSFKPTYSGTIKWKNDSDSSSEEELDKIIFLPSAHERIKGELVKFIPIFELPILIIMVLIRAAILRRGGIKAMVFGATDKTDYILVPIIFSLFYGITASVFNLPFPVVLKEYFIENEILVLCGTIVCTAALIWFGITLKTFGKSFRVGIDKNTKDKLITNGIFSLSRNPIYVGFIAFFAGIFLAYMNIVVLVFLVFIITAIHRQILREEKFLKSCYGKEYDEYCNKVRRYV
ncbi:MAG: isoprenylcysteine carboxylmethyltransferase family protein [Fibromonadaceae bacterium]|nr:isoprenylcysteine carboxylmethyltransferase family protein [Fibromonadaceae bacterium]